MVSAMEGQALLSRDLKHDALRRFVSAFALLGLTVWNVGNLRAAELRFLYTSGDVAPGTLEEGVFNNFGDAGFDAKGRIVFQAYLGGSFVNSLNDTGVWGVEDGRAKLLIREGRNLELGKPIFLGQHRVMGISDAGAMVLTTDVPAVISVGPDGVTTPATFFGPIRGQSSSTRFGATEAQVSGIGQIYGRAQLIGDDVNFLNDEAIWTSNNGAPGELFAQKGEPVAGLSSPPATWGGFNYLTVNRSGMIAARARIRDGVSIENGNYNTLLTYTTQSGWKRVATLLDPVPNSNSVFGDLYVPALNESGDLAFYGFTGEASEGGIFTYDESRGIQRLVQVGTQVTGADGSSGTLQWGDLNSTRQHPQLLFDDQNRVLFEGRLFDSKASPESDQVFWSADGSGVKALLREGDPVAGRSGDWVLGGGPGNSFGFGGSLNASGWAAIGSPVYDRVTGQIGGALWSISPTGNVETIVSAGDQLEIGPGDTRTLKWVTVMAGDDRSGFRPVNEHGSVVLYVAFTDGSSGLMQYSVPELTTASLDAIAISWLWGRRRSKRL